LLFLFGGKKRMSLRIIIKSYVSVIPSVIKLICIPIKVWSVNSYISSAGKMMVKSLRGQASILKAMLLCFFLGNVTMFPALSSLLDS
jgi:hypothetical protein